VCVCVCVELRDEDVIARHLVSHIRNLEGMLSLILSPSIKYLLWCFLFKNKGWRTSKLAGARVSTKHMYIGIHIAFM
jgi:hypothetical protein